MDKIGLAKKICLLLSQFEPVISDCGSSVYVKLNGSKIKQIRVSDHNGRKASKNSWQVRSDCCTCRSKGIFSVLDLNLMASLVRPLTPK